MSTFRDFAACKGGEHVRLSTPKGGDSGLVEGVPREQKMLKGHPPRVIYHQLY